MQNGVGAFVWIHMLFGVICYYTGMILLWGGGSVVQSCPQNASRWMRDLFSLEANRGDSGKWLTNAIGRKIKRWFF